MDTKSYINIKFGSYKSLVDIIVPRSVSKLKALEVNIFMSLIVSLSLLKLNFKLFFSCIFVPFFCVSELRILLHYFIIKNSFIILFFA